tara:strand:+ start:1888 stop:5664 length:3777 start_codon:yes stop_codon:yes gene_type:complete
MFRWQYARFLMAALLICTAGNFAAQAQSVDASFRLDASKGSIETYHETGPVAIHLANNNRVIACEFAPNPSRRALAARITAFVVFDLTSGREISRLPYSADFVSQKSACSPDGRYLVICERESAKLFDLDTQSLVRSWPVKYGRAIPVIDPNGATLALCREREITLWQLPSGEPAGQIPDHPTAIVNAAFDDQGKYFLSSCGEMTRRWDLDNKSPVTIPVEGRLLWYLATDRQREKVYGTHHIHAGEGGAASFDMRSGRRGLYLKNHYSMETDPDNDRLYTINSYGDESIDAVQVRRLSDPDEVKYLPFGPQVREALSRDKVGFVDDLRLSPDRRYLLVRLEYGRLSQIWKVDDQFEQKLTASDSGLERRYVPEQPKVEKKTREELFLEEIKGITYKVNDLKEQGAVKQAEQEIEALLAAGRRRLQRAPKRHQLLIGQCGQAYRNGLRQPEKALPLFIKAAEMAEAGNRFDSRWEYLVKQISWTYRDLGDQAAAAKALRRVVDRRRADGKPFDVSNNIILAELIFDRDDPEVASEAIELLIQAWTRVKTEAGTLSSSARRLYDQVAEFVKQADRWEVLEPILVEQLAAHELHLGANHPDTAQAALQLAQLYERLGRPSEALALMDRNQRTLRDHVARLLPLLSEQEQGDFLKEHFRSSLLAAFAMAVRLQEHPDAATISAGWILNAKGAATRVLAERARTVASTQDPAVRSIASELAETRNRISSVSLVAAQTPDIGLNRKSEERSELAQLRKRESELSWQLGQAGWTELRQEPWTDLDDVRQRIPEDSVLIELTVTTPLGRLKDRVTENFGRVSRIGIDSGDPKVIAWIIPPAGQGEVRMIVLCQQWETLSRPLAHFHEILRGQIISNHPEAEIARCLQEMSTYLTEPLPADVWEKKKWLISPDHRLWTAPWAAFPGKEKGFLVQSHEVRYLLSGRDLLPLASLDHQSPPMIVAAPDYGAANDDGNGQDGGSESGPFVPLPGTAEEARSVLPYLRELAGDEPKVYLGAEAEEAIVKTAKRPQVAVFSTHGFSEPRLNQHPLATCGLAFRNANTAIEGTGDGVLTGLEVLATDYRGTELVVLSACQTGLGTVQDGEGVAGLRLAFQLAGARNVAATLWSIPDKITAEMMTEFFKHYASGHEASSALRLAQLAIIEKFTEAGYRPSPRLWAAFTIAGPPPERLLPGKSADQTAPTSLDSGRAVRTWRSADGKYSVRAEFVSSDGQNVVLRRTDGTETRVPLEKLHAEDRRTIETLKSKM